MLHLDVSSYQPDILSSYLEEDGLIPLDQDEHYTAITDPCSILSVFVVDCAFPSQAGSRRASGSWNGPQDLEGENAGVL